MQFDESSDDGIEDNDDDVVPTNTMTISTSSSSYTNPNRDNHAAAATSSLAMSSTSLSTPPQPNQRISETVCTPIGECEQCPSKWNVLIEKEESTIKGEYESCYEYGRRIQFECTVLFQGKCIIYCVGGGRLRITCSCGGEYCSVQLEIHFSVLLTL